ncbi:hypothetical protein ACFPJ1_17945 [Kribbella qitaiheensis]|uniref:hypothetical protein n=1 Tax=Kribbella qitaiheensis TaxID=1544730 RepID=UPI003613AFDB
MKPKVTDLQQPRVRRVQGQPVLRPVGSRLHREIPVRHGAGRQARAGDPAVPARPGLAVPGRPAFAVPGRPAPAVQGRAQAGAVPAARMRKKLHHFGSAVVCTW